MLRELTLFACVLVTTGALHGAERNLDLSAYLEGPVPKDFRPLLVGTGAPGAWRIASEDLPTLLPRVTPGAPARARLTFMEHHSTDTTDSRQPLLLLNDEGYGDFTFTTRFKIMEGSGEQKAGIVFRLQDERNFYVFRVDAREGSAAFYPVVDGQFGQAFRVPAALKRGAWHEMAVECDANKIRCFLDGAQVLPPPPTNAPAGAKILMPSFVNNIFKQGHLGWWTQADSPARFTDPRLTYTPRISFAQRLVDDTLRDYPRLINLIIHAPTGPAREIKSIAAKNPADIGQPAREAEKDICANGRIWTAREAKTYVVMMPLHDRNGETVGACTVVMTTFIGQTENNAIARAMPVVKQMESRIQSAKDLLD